MELCGCASHPGQSNNWEHCRLCGRPPEVCGPISRRGRCLPCANTAVIESAWQLAHKRGDRWQRWKAGMRAAADRQP